LVALAVSQFKVDKHIKQLTEERNTFESDLQTARDSERSAKSDAKKANEALKQANSRLATVTNELAAVTAKRDEQEQRANRWEEKWNADAKSLNEAQQKLARWAATGLEPDQVQAFVDNAKKVALERDIFAEEKTILLRNNAQILAKLLLYEKPAERVIMRFGLKGKVVAVDPKWEFVILDIGSDQGVLERGEFLVNRGGKLVAKVRVTSVERNRSIANILPEWKQTDVIEGDQVLY
jgi:hypothetical protein